jgi:anthranilate phosphoribosyltransferase
VVSGAFLTRGEMRGVIRSVMSGDESELQIAGLLAALRTRGETVDEIVGAAQAMRELALRLPTAPEGAVDTCGTGGDGANTFNISTLAALVVAGAGVPVAKHGNRAATSQCGSAEVLEELGVRLDTPPERMAQSIAEVGIGFLFARACHPAMAAVAPIRAALPIPTVFNRLGPLANPMGVKRQLLGVGRPDHLESSLQAMIELGTEAVWVVHGEDGLDEISTAAATTICAYQGGEIQRFRLAPGEHVPEARSGDLKGGDAAANAQIAREILDGETGPRRDIVVLNAAATLCVSGRAAGLPEGIALAQDSIDRGRARDVLERWVAFTHREAR